MMSRPWGINGYSEAGLTRTSKGSVTPAPGESGVYNSVAPRQALPSFWREEDDEQLTSLRRSQLADAGTILPPQPLQPKRKLWQVALRLRGDELSRLWRRNSVHLAGRVFVWSDYSNAWVQLDASPEFAYVHFAEPLPIVQTPVLQSPPKPGALVRMQDVVDLTSLAKPVLGHFPSRWAFGLAASLVTLVGLAALLPRKTTNQPTAQHVTVQPVAPEAAAPRTSQPEPIPVSKLPLLSAGLESKAAGRTANGVLRTSYDSGQHESVSATPAFNPSAARQVLSRAAWHADHCASGDLSGSVLVTYEPSGLVSDVRINALAGDLSRSECIVNAFRGARIAPFAGQRLVVKKSF